MESDRQQTADSEKHLVNSTRKNKQSDGMEERQQETHMMMCCCGDVILLTQNRINEMYKMKLFCDYYFMHYCSYACSGKIQLFLNFLLQTK